MLCREAGVRPSMGSVGDAYDNAMAESFFATPECELLDRRRFKTQAEARIAVFEFIVDLRQSAPKTLIARVSVTHELREPIYRDVPRTRRTRQLLDLQLEMGDQRFTAGQVRLSIGRFGFGNRCIGLGHDARVALRQDQRMSGGKIRWQRFKFRCHSATESYSSKTSKQEPLFHRGRTPGFLRMTPVDSREQVTELRGGDCHRAGGALGHKKRPRSNRLVNRHAPRPSCQITFKRSPLRPRKQNSWPLNGSRCSISCTCSDRLANALPHVGVAGRQPYPNAGWKCDHGSVSSPRMIRRQALHC